MDGKNEQIEVGQRLRSARETLGLTQEDVASALRIPRTSVISMEAGKRNVSALELRQLARLYRRSVTWLLGEEPENTGPASAQDQALYRAASELSAEDREQVLRFAQFLAGAQSSSARRLSRRRAAGNHDSPPTSGED